MKRVLVTGATGFFGGNILRELCAQGFETTYLSRGGKPAVAAEGTNARCLAGDVTDPASLEAACAGVDWIIHSAALVSFSERDRPEMERVNVRGTEDLLAAAKRADVKRFVLVSTVDTLYDFKGMRNPYPETKIAQEWAVLTAPIDTVVVNPGFMIGAYDPKPSSSRIILEIMRGRGVFCSSGGNSFVDVLDVVRGTLLAAEKGEKGKRYVLAGHNLTYREFFTRAARLCGKRPPIAAMPQVVTAMAATLAEWWASLTGSAPMITRGEVQFAGLPHYFDSSLAERELGYVISPIEPAIERARDWFIATKRV